MNLVDPTGQFSLVELTVANAIENVLAALDKVKAGAQYCTLSGKAKAFGEVGLLLAMGMGVVVWSEALEAALAGDTKFDVPGVNVPIWKLERSPKLKEGESGIKEFGISITYDSPDYRSTEASSGFQGSKSITSKFELAAKIKAQSSRGASASRSRRASSTSSARPRSA